MCLLRPVETGHTHTHTHTHTNTHTHTHTHTLTYTFATVNLLTTENATEKVQNSKKYTKSLKFLKV